MRERERKWDGEMEREKMSGQQKEGIIILYDDEVEIPPILKRKFLEQRISRTSPFLHYHFSLVLTHPHSLLRTTPYYFLQLFEPRRTEQNFLIRPSVPGSVATNFFGKWRE